MYPPRIGKVEEQLLMYPPTPELEKLKQERATTNVPPQDWKS